MNIRTTIVASLLSLAVVTSAFAQTAPEAAEPAMVAPEAAPADMGAAPIKHAHKHAHKKHGHKHHKKHGHKHHKKHVAA